MEIVSFYHEDQKVFNRIARALEGIESKMTPAKVVEYGPETGEAVQKLLSNIADDIEEELEDRMKKACAKYMTGVLYGPENLYMAAVSDFMEVFHRALDKMEYEMKKEGKK